MKHITKRPAEDSLEALLRAMSAELRAIAAFGRATMHGVATLSPEAARAIDEALDKESRVVAIDDLDGQDVLNALLIDARRRLNAALAA